VNSIAKDGPAFLRRPPRSNAARLALDRNRIPLQQRHEIMRLELAGPARVLRHADLDLVTID
jgi:hypothetical protein